MLLIFNNILRNFEDCIPMENLKIRKMCGILQILWNFLNFKKNLIKVPWKVSLLSSDFFIQYTTMKRNRGPEKNMQKARGPTRGNLFDKFIRRPTFRCIPWDRINGARAEVSRQFEWENRKRERERWLELPRTVFPPNLLAIIHRCNGRLLTRRKNERGRTFPPLLIPSFSNRN